MILESRLVTESDQRLKSAKSFRQGSGEQKDLEQNVKKKWGKDAPVRVSCLNLVDLAGSERQKKAKTTAVRLREGAQINKSLMTLGSVIFKLSEGEDTKAGGHVNFRDSKLTRLLSNSLGGNAKTFVLTNISPAGSNRSETISTLQFASRAKKIINKARQNEIGADNSLLDNYRAEIELLRAKLEDQTTDHGEVLLMSTVEKMEEDHETEKQRLRDEVEAHKTEAEGHKQQTEDYKTFLLTSARVAQDPSLANKVSTLGAQVATGRRRLRSVVGEMNNMSGIFAAVSTSTRNSSRARNIPKHLPGDALGGGAENGDADFDSDDSDEAYVDPSSMGSMMERLKEEMRVKDDAIRAKDRDNKTLERKSSILQQELLSHKQDKSALGSSHMELQAGLEAEAEAHAAARVELQSMDKKMRSASTEHSRLQSEVSSLRSSLNGHDDSKREMKKTLNELELSTGRWQARLEAKTDEHLATKQQLLEAQRTAKTWEARHEEVKQALDTTLEEYLQLHKVYLESKGVADNHHKRAETLDRDKVKAGTDQDRLRLVIAGKDEEIEELQKLIEEGKEEKDLLIMNARKELEFEHGELLRSKTVCDAKEHTIWEQKSKHQELKQDFENLKVDMEAMQGSAKSRETQYGSINKKALELMKDKEAEHAEVHRHALKTLNKKDEETASLRTTLEEVRAEFEAFQDGVGQAEGESKTLQQMMLDVKTEMHKKVLALESLEGVVRDREDELAGASAALVEKSRQIEDVQESRLVDEEEIDRLRSILATRTQQDLVLNKKQMELREVLKKKEQEHSLLHEKALHALEATAEDNRLLEYRNKDLVRQLSAKGNENASLHQSLGDTSLQLQSTTESFESLQEIRSGDESRLLGLEIGMARAAEEIKDREMSAKMAEDELSLSIQKLHDEVSRVMCVWYVCGGGVFVVVGEKCARNDSETEQERVIHLFYAAFLCMTHCTSCSIDRFTRHRALHECSTPNPSHSIVPPLSRPAYSLLFSLYMTFRCER